MRELKLGSLFDGSGGFPLAGALNGIKPVWASEIEPFPIRVTKNRFPNMKHLGSVTDINGAEIEPVDIITFGSPCQDLSVAGKQLGIHDGQRSNLCFEAIRIIKEMRNHDRATGRADDDLRPRFAVWENVPGAFSSNKGADFQAVLQAFCDIEGAGITVPMPPKGKWNPAGCIVGDGWSLAWRVYDAQFWGVPQRRKRIYLIADFGRERAGKILFECESVPWDSAQGRETGEGTAAHAEGSAGRSSGVVYESKSLLEENWTERTVKNALRAEPSKSASCVVEKVASFMGGQGEKARSIQNYTPGGISGTLDASYYKGPGARNGKEREFLAVETEKAPRKYIVRRLTPTECARLQGFPDWWCDGADGSDSAQYKLWGNGIALPCAVDVIGRIANELRKEDDIVTAPTAERRWIWRDWMTTDELIKALRGEAHKAYPLAVSELMSEASDRLEEQDKIIKQYQKADCFLAAHGWEWEEGGNWYDNG